MLRLSLTIVVLALAVPPLALSAQERRGQEASRAFLTRAELADLQARYRAYAESPAYSSRLRARARDEADEMQARLSQGDFDVGDRVLLIVEGEAALSDTFTVSRGRILRLGDMGEVPLAGVLRSEFESQLGDYLGRFLREPETRTESYLRIAVDGAVLSPGFLRVPANIQLSDVLTLAGGLAQNAKLDDIRIYRGDRRIWSGYPLQEAQEGGLTVDQMRLRDGDRIVVPERRTFTYNTARTIGLILGIPLSVAAVISLF